MSTINIRPSIWERLNEELSKDNEMLHAENALKLTQILDLEQLLYDNRILDEQDGSPCWCCQEPHAPECVKARQATEPFWKKPNVQP